MWSRAGVLAITTARWGEAEAFIRNAIETATNHGDRRLLDECAVLLAAIAFFRGRHAEAGALYASVLEAARRSGTHQVARWATLGGADVSVRRGQYREAIAIYDRELASPGLVATERVWAHGMRSLARLRSGERGRAGEDALAALALLDRSPPVAYWIQHGVHAMGRVLLELSPPDRPSAAALRGVMHATILAGVAGLARPAAALVQGELLGRLGRPTAARWVLARGRRLGEELGMPYEAAMGELSIARGEGSEGGEQRARLLARARERLLAIEAEGDAQEASRAL
jgi:tetratricopeptide (TPR) repeat protein